MENYNCDQIGVIKYTHLDQFKIMVGAEWVLFVFAGILWVISIGPRRNLVVKLISVNIWGWWGNA